MLKTIILNDIKQNIWSLKLQITFIIMLVVFLVGTIAYVIQYRESLADYRSYTTKNEQEIRNTADINITRLAVENHNYLLSPPPNGFIDDAKYQYTPNNLKYNAYNVYEYTISRTTSNPYLYLSSDLNWVFIISIITSFTVLLLSYNAISGEREQQTLKLILSNAVPRGVLLLGKYLSIVISGILMVLPGILLSLIVIIVSGVLIINMLSVFEVIGFIIIAILFIATVSALGLFCSVISRSATISLLISLTLWALFLVFSPNLAVFASEHFYKIKNSETIQNEIKSAADAINKAAPEGSWSMWSDNPFFEKHKLRAENITNLMNSEKQIRDEWYNRQFRQYEIASWFSFISPISLFGVVSESVVGNGYPRFQKNWNDIHVYQTQFLAWFKANDDRDPESPHWYNPSEDVSTSRRKVKFEEIPLYSEATMSIKQRLQFALPGVTLLILYSVVLMGITIILFNRYDVR